MSADGVKVVDDKIMEWPTPVNLEELRLFFLEIAHIAAPQHALTEKLKPWEWTGFCDEAFVQLMTTLSSHLILSFPQFNMGFTVDCDASLEGLGAVLSQEDDRCVVAYASHVLTKQEQQYCATRREMLALVWAIHYFKPYFSEHPFIVRTDHSTLKCQRSCQNMTLQWNIAQALSMEMLTPYQGCLLGSVVQVKTRWDINAGLRQHLYILN